MLEESTNGRTKFSYNRCSTNLYDFVVSNCTLISRTFPQCIVHFNSVSFKQHKKIKTIKLHDLFCSMLFWEVGEKNILNVKSIEKFVWRTFVTCLIQFMFHQLLSHASTEVFPHFFHVFRLWRNDYGTDIRTCSQAFFFFQTINSTTI